MIEIDRGEVRRYLGFKNGQIDESTEGLIDACITKLNEEAVPKSVFHAFDLENPVGNVLKVEGLCISSANLAKNLKGCSCVYLMAATLGVGVDRLIARASATEMSRAVVYQAAAAAMIEAYCDGINEALCREAERENLYCRPRFSPGYGDFDIKHQMDFARLLDTPRKIGLTVTEGMALAPSKSVTAIIGLSRDKQPCHIKGCEVCDKTNCAFRR